MFTVLLLIFSIAFAVLAWTNLRTASFFILALLPTYLIRFSVGSLPLTVLELMLLMVIVVWLVRHQGYRKFNRSYLVPTVLLLLAATISLFVTPDTMAALGVWKAYFIEPILFFFVLRSVLKTRADAQQAILSLGAGMLLVAGFAVLQKITGLALPEPWDLTRRVTSFFSYPNAVGLYLAPLIVLGFAALSQTLRKSYSWLTYFWVVVLGLSILAIIFSETEAAWVAVPIGLWVISWFSKRLRQWTVPISAVVLIIILAVPMLRSPVLEKITLQDYSGGVRLSQWSDTIEFLKDHTLFGAGLSGYPEAIRSYHQTEYIEIFQYPHNIILNTWVELGLLGVIALVALAVAVIRKTYQGLRSTKSETWLVLGCFGALLVMAIHGLVDVPYLKNDLAVMTWSILALLAFATKKPYET